MIYFIREVIHYHDRYKFKWFFDKERALRYYNKKKEYFEKLGFGEDEIRLELKLIEYKG